MFATRIHQSKSTIDDARVLGGAVAATLARGVLILGAALLTLEATACVSSSDELADGLDTQSYKELTCNGLTPDALAENLPALSAVADGPLINGALSDGTLLLDSEAFAAMSATATGMDVLDYAIECALSSDDVVFTSAEGGHYGQRGRLGLAPQWKERALDTSAQRALSACILSHVNLFGVHVPFSARDYAELETSSDEIARYSRYEATFYGNLFAATPSMYVCSGDPAPDMSVPYGSHDLTFGDRLLRRCSDVDNSGDSSDSGTGETLCGFTLVGSCSDVCDSQVEGSHQSCWDTPAKDGVSFAETVSAWTLAHDDPESVWPQLYHEVYGPGEVAEKNAGSTPTPSSSDTARESGRDRGPLAKSSVAKLAGQFCPN